MSDKRRLHGEERRNKIISLLQESSSPLTGGALVDQLNVSRQITVQDI
ncbi:HTH domain-containing protein, partial [Pseudomonas sp. 2822-15]